MTGEHTKSHNETAQETARACDTHRRESTTRGENTQGVINARWKNANRVLPIRIRKIYEIVAADLQVVAYKV